MTGTIADRIAAGADRDFVGRGHELAALRAAATDAESPFVVAFVHGPGGIGKSRLLQRLAATTPEVTTLAVDGRGVEPTPRGFREAVGRLLDVEGEPGTASIVQALRRAGPVVLAVDTYEVLGLLDGWLRTRFLPALPTSVLTVFAGRDRPAAAWHTAAGWANLVAEFPLAALAPSEAHALLRARGLGDAQVGPANEFARGHPLALELVAAGVSAGAAAAVDVGRAPAPAGLVEAFLGGLPATTVAVVESASTVRRVTEPVLRTMLDVPDARTAFDTLRGLPFTEPSRDGLLLHDVVRDTVGRDLALRDPDLRRTYRRRAADHLTGRTAAAAEDLWGHTADLMFLIENPVVRDACFPSTRPHHVVEPARPDDGPVIAEIAGRHEPPACAAALGRWWDRHPDSFAVARDPDGHVDAFVQILERGEVDPAVLAADPVTRPWTEHLRDHPPGPDDRVLMMRRWLGAESGERRAPAVSACWLDVKRVYMELRPRLRRLYSVVVDLAHLGPIFLPLGFAPVGDPVVVDGVAYQCVYLDFGPESVDGWLGRLVYAETDPPPERPDRASGLSPRELEVLRLVGEGHSNREIGGQLHVSERTVSRHVSNLLAKLGARTRTDAVRIAAARDLC